MLGLWKVFFIREFIEDLKKLKRMSLILMDLDFHRVLEG